VPGPLRDALPGNNEIRGRLKTYFLAVCYPKVKQTSREARQSCYLNANAAIPRQMTQGIIHIHDAMLSVVRSHSSHPPISEDIRIYTCFLSALFIARVRRRSRSISCSQGTVSSRYTSTKCSSSIVIAFDFGQLIARLRNACYHLADHASIVSSHSR